MFPPQGTDRHKEIIASVQLKVVLVSECSSLLNRPKCWRSVKLLSQLGSCICLEFLYFQDSLVFSSALSYRCRKYYADKDTWQKHFNYYFIVDRPIYIGT